MKHPKRFALRLWAASCLAAVAGCSDEPAVQMDSSQGEAVSAGEAAAPVGETAPSGIEESGTAEAGPPAAGGSMAGAAAPASAAGAVLQTQETNVPGLVADLVEAEREDGVLTVKVRFRNTGSEEIYHGFETHHGRYESHYVTAEDKKYFVLKDSEGEPLAPKYLNVDLDPGQSSLWWAKFPAPPTGVSEFDLVMIDVLPFEDVPITDS